jgi:hypothetical protein
MNQSKDDKNKLHTPAKDAENKASRQWIAQEEFDDAGESGTDARLKLESEISQATNAPAKESDREESNPQTKEPQPKDYKENRE